MKHRCRECTLLRVETEGDVCDECVANGAMVRASDFVSVTITLEPAQEVYGTSLWIDCGAPPSSLFIDGQG